MTLLTAFGFGDGSFAVAKRRAICGIYCQGGVVPDPVGEILLSLNGSSAELTWASNGS